MRRLLRIRLIVVLIALLLIPAFTLPYAERLRTAWQRYWEPEPPVQQGIAFDEIVVWDLDRVIEARLAEIQDVDLQNPATSERAAKEANFLRAMQQIGPLEPSEDVLIYYPDDARWEELRAERREAPPAPDGRR